MVNNNTMTELKTEIWCRKYWYVAITIALSYPLNPTENIKKKYYDLYQNIFLFLPANDDIRPFYHYIETYPITPYLDSRESLLDWLFYVYGKIHDDLGIKRKTRADLMNDYEKTYIPEEIVDYEYYRKRRYVVGASIVLVTLYTAYRLHKSTHE